MSGVGLSDPELRALIASIADERIAIYSRARTEVHRIGWKFLQRRAEERKPYIVGELSPELVRTQFNTWAAKQAVRDQGNPPAKQGWARRIAQWLAAWLRPPLRSQARPGDRQ